MSSLCVKMEVTVMIHADGYRYLYRRSRVHCMYLDKHLVYSSFFLFFFFFSFDREEQPFNLNNGKFSFTIHCVLLVCIAGRGSSIGSAFAMHASGPEFEPHVRHNLSWRLGHENISTAILPLPLIQEEQLSVIGERMCTKYW